MDYLFNMDNYEEMLMYLVVILLLPHLRECRLKNKIIRINVPINLFLKGVKLF